MPTAAHPPLQEIADLLARTRDDVLVAWEAFPPDTREWRPAPGRWTAAEVLDHLSKVEAGSAALLAKRLQRAREAGLGPETDHHSRLGAFDAHAFVVNGPPLDAPEVSRPAADVRAADAEAGLRASRAALDAVIADASGLALGEVKARHLRFGEIDFYQWLLFVALHERRHLRQLADLRAAPAGSPPARLAPNDRMPPPTPLAALPTRPQHAPPAYVYAVVETPKGSRSKYDYEPALGVFMLTKEMPAGHVFPYDFGFVPGTLGGDGDPLDVLVLLDDAAYPGVVLEARLVGVFEAEQTERDGRREENDRLVAVAACSRRHADVRTLDDLGAATLGELEHFFRSYNEETGKRVAFKGRGGPERAAALVDEGVGRARAAR